MARKIEVQIVGDSSSVERAFGRAGASAGVFGGKMARMGRLATLALGGAVVGGFAKSIKAAADFQTSLNTFQAVSQATGSQMEKVSALAKKLGADVTLPATSAKDAADAMVEMSKAGMSVKNTMAATKGVLLMSAAAETDNAYAAQVTANALNAFSLKGKEAGHVADLLAAASVAASGEMTDMADSLSYVSATAAQSGQSIDSAVTAIAEMANKGIIGSQSGAALQQMLLRLESPTKKATEALKKLNVSVYDQRGKMLPLRDIVGQFSKATEGMSDKQRNAAMNTIFGTRAIRAANIVLLGGVGAYDKMAKAVGRSGAAQDLAKAKMKGFNGAMESLKSSVETLEITLGTPFLGALTKAAYALANITGHIEQVAGGKGSIGQKLQTLFGDAVGVIDWSAVWSRARGMGAGLKASFESIDWGASGQAIGDGIAAAVERAIKNTKGMPTAFLGMVDSIDWEKIGKKMGPGLATAVVSAFVAITDPAFWVRNWDLALAVALTVFGKGIGKLAGKFMLPLRRVFSDAIVAVADWLDSKGASLLAYSLLGAMERLPKIAKASLRKLEDLVGRVFGRLSGLAKFTVKVLGIREAINWVADMAANIKEKIEQVVRWFKGLPGRIVGAIGNVDLSAIGRRMVQGIIDGMSSKIGDLVKKAGDVVGAAKRRLEFWHSPPDAYGRYIGESVAGGIASGLDGRIASVVAAAGRLVNSAKQRMNEAARDVARLQVQMDAEARRREDRDNRKALADAEKQLAEARKKGKGLADAERAVQDALERIHDTARQREIDKAQKQYDKLQKAYDAASAKMEKAQQKAADRLRKLQDTAGTAFDKLAGKIQSAFDAKNGAWVAPAQQAIDAINDRRAQEDLQSAADDAQKAYEDALLGGDPAEIARKLRDRDRALEDITVAGLEKQAAAQTTAHDQWVAAQQEALDGMLENLRTKLTEQGTAWDDGLTGILGVISSYDGDFGSMGDLLGGAFTKSLMDSVYAAVDAAAAVAGVQSPVSDAKMQAQAQAALEAAQKAGKPAWQQALDARGAGMNAKYGGGVTKNYNLNVGQVVQRNADEIPQTLRNMERLAA